jgi:8-amino-7-oxononanoate synthase
VERAEDAVLGMGACNSSTTIVGESHEALAPSEHLARNGMLAAAVRPPTVPVGSSRLWLAVQSSHEPEDIDRLIAVLGGQR